MEFEPIFITYGSLIAMAMLPIWMGSHLSIEEEKDAKSEDRLTGADAYLFPVIGSVFLFSFYLVFKFCPKEYINYLLTAYFSVFGTASLSKLLVRLFQFAIPSKFELMGHWKITMERGKEEKHEFKVTWLNVLMTILTATLSVYYGWSKNWITSNVFGVAFSISAISMIHLDKFSTGMILLSGLFLYDIFWVFGTDVMVTVAKNFDVPIKLLFPRNVFDIQSSAMSMLGLGDIVLPGCFLALCLKFDKHLKNCFNWYFTVGMVFYLVGLATTMAVMHFFKAAQPALLYLSPACILSASLTALVRGELDALFKFESGPETAVKPSNAASASPKKAKGE